MNKNVETRTVTLSIAQIEKIMQGLKALPAEPSSPHFHTDAPHELVSMFQDSIDNCDSGTTSSFVL